MKGRFARIADAQGNLHLYDFGTSNKSFLQVAKDLRTVGVKNCYFMLEIYDVSLVEINPYAVDENGHTTLTKDQVSRICTECYRNIWYYLREIARIPDPGGASIPYIANRGNIAQAWCLWKGLDSWLCLPRQQGKTQSALAAIAWSYSFGTTNSQFIFVHKDGEGSKNNLRRLGDQIRCLPEYLRFESYTNDDGKTIKAGNNATMIMHPVNKNSILAKARTSGYEGALSLARGLTSALQYFDEPEFTDNIKTIIENSVSTFETASERAKQNHAMYGRIFTCTPGDLATKAGAEAELILNSCAQWNEKLYDYTDEKIQQYILSQGSQDEKGTKCNGILYIEYQYYQIGKTEAWVEKMKRLINNKLVVRREILLQRLHGSSANPYPPDAIEYIVGTQHVPIDEIWIMDFYKFDVYKELDKKIPYILGVDCSTGTNGDNNAITVLNPYTLEPDAEFSCPYIGETKYELLITEFVLKYAPRSIVCIERNSVGDSIVDHLMYSKISNRLYYDKNKDLVEQKSKENESIESMLKKRASEKTYYGVWTGPDSRDAMFSILARHVEEYKDKFITRHIIKDLAGLVVLSSGKIAAGPGQHDDNIMSYLIALYVYYHGNNLPLFGIQPGSMEVGELNSGLRRTDEIDETLLPREILNQIKKEEQIEEAEAEWRQNMQLAYERAQKETYRLQKANLIQNSIYDPKNSPEVILADDYENEDMDLDIFDELNDW